MGRKRRRLRVARRHLPSRGMHLHDSPVNNWLRSEAKAVPDLFFLERQTAMVRVGSGEHSYELIRDFLKMPNGEGFGLVSRVAADSQDHIYVFQRKEPPVAVFDCEG